jgi:hypothetical protein
MVVAQARVELLGVTPRQGKTNPSIGLRAVAVLLEGSLLRLRARIIGAAV